MISMNGSWYLLAALGLLTLSAAVLTVRGFGVVRIGWLNFSRLRELSRQQSETADPAEKAALALVIDACQELRGRWILNEADLRPAGKTLGLVTAIARSYHSASPAPLAEARLGDLLDAFQEIKTRLLALARLPGIKRVTQFRLRHLVLLAEAWRKKEAFFSSPTWRAAEKYRVLFIVRWGYALWRALDAGFWTLKMLGYVLKDVVMKVLLIRWYLTVGELAIGVYGGGQKAAALSDEDIEKKLEGLPEVGPPPDLSPEAGPQAAASRKALLLYAGRLDAQAMSDNLGRLTYAIARAHHPASEKPLFEARLYSLILAVARLSDDLASLRNRGVWGRLLDFRVRHLLWMKDAAEYLKDSAILAWLQKTGLHHVVKYSHLLYKVVKKKHPGLLAKDLALTLVMEGAKRWLAVYVHDKVALEADRLYLEKAPPSA